MMLRYSFIFLVAFISCASQLPINLIPMYGNAVKTERQKALDQKFIDIVVKEYGSREAASKKHSDFGWSYLAKNNVSTAMKRFNQAWLLDDTNANSYWGFSAVYQIIYPKKRTEIVDFLLTAQKYDPDNYEILRDLGMVHAKQIEELPNITPEQKDSLYNKASDFYTRAIAMNQTDPDLYFQLAATHFLVNKHQEAKDCLSKTATLELNSAQELKIKQLKTAIDNH